MARHFLGSDARIRRDLDEDVFVFLKRVQQGKDLQRDLRKSLKLHRRDVFLPDGTFLRAVIVAQAGFAVGLRHGQDLVRVGGGALGLHLFDAVCGDVDHFFRRGFAGEPGSLSRQLILIFVGFHGTLAHCLFPPAVSRRRSAAAVLFLCLCPV